MCTDDFGRSNGSVQSIASLAVFMLGACGAAGAADPAWVEAAIAHSPSSAAVGDMVRDVTQDMPIATPVAAVMLGASDAQVPRVASLRDAAVSFSNGLDKNGKIVQAVGAELSPALLLRPLRWKELEHWPMRAWARTTVSFAMRPSADAASARSALGVQSVLYSREADEAIALAANNDCQAIARNHASKPAPPPLVPGDPLPQSTLTAAELELLGACMQLIQATLNRWNPTTLAVGMGQAFYSGDASLRSSASAASSWWVTAAWGRDFEGFDISPQQRWGMGITAHWRRAIDERSPDPADGANLLTESARLWALNLRLGTPKAAVLAEVSRRRARLDGYADENRRRAMLGAELRLRPGLYLALGLADDRGARNGKEQRAALANLKWGLGEKSVLGGL